MKCSIRLCPGDFAEAGGGCKGGCSNLTHRERSAGSGEVGVVDDVEAVYPELESQAFIDLEVLGYRGVEVSFAGCPVGVSTYVAKAGRDDLSSNTVDGVVDRPRRRKWKRRIGCGILILQ